MVWDNSFRQRKLKPGQLFHVPTLIQKMRTNYAKDTSYVRSREFNFRMLCKAVPTRMPEHEDEADLDETLGIPAKIVNGITRRRSRSMDQSAMAGYSSFYDTSSPTSSPVREGGRKTTIEVVEDEDDDNVFCSIPASSTPQRSRSPVRRQFKTPAAKKKRNQPQALRKLTHAQVEEVKHRKANNNYEGNIAIRAVAKEEEAVCHDDAVMLNKSMFEKDGNISAIFLPEDDCESVISSIGCDPAPVHESSGRKKNKKKQVKLDKSRKPVLRRGPRSSTPVQQRQELTLGSEMDGTTFMFPSGTPHNQSSSGKRKADSSFHSARKRVKMIDNPPRPVFSVKPGLRRKLFGDMCAIAL